MCSACSEHVRVSDSLCPHCGAAISPAGGLGRAVLTAAAVAGLLTSCTAEPDYGVPVTDSVTAATEGADTEVTDGTTEGDSSSTGAPTTGGTETDGETATDTGSSDDTGNTTVSEPDYGVPGTTGSESDYGVAAT